MGFRDLTHFNKALLAKQVWRIIENPKSLVSRLLKACYFKHTDIMDASYIWRSLLWSKDITRAGTFWKVGDGKNINARRDNWIPSLHSGKITSHVSYDSNMSINNLISNDSNLDTDKLKSIFLPYEVDVIRRIPITGPNQPDTRYWRLEKKGSYYVKTGYWNTHHISRQSTHHDEMTCCSTKDPF